MTFSGIFPQSECPKIFLANKETDKLVACVAVAAVSLHRGFPAVHSLGSSSHSYHYLVHVSCSDSRSGFLVVRRMASNAHFSYGTTTIL